MNAIHKSLMALALAGLLGGCNSGPDEAPAELEVVRAIGDLIKARRNPRPEPTQLSRALLDTVTQPYIELTRENQDITGYLTKQLVHDDGYAGTVVVWRAEDGASLSLRNGLLIATRGLGDDLLSAQVPAADGVVGPVGSSERRYQIRGFDNQAYAVTFGCSLQDLGPAPIEVVEITYPTRHLQEHCDSPSGQVVNDYWVDSRSGQIWQSRQWAGPTLGYLRIRQLTI